MAAQTGEADALALLVGKSEIWRSLPAPAHPPRSATWRYDAAHTTLVIAIALASGQTTIAGAALR